MKALNRYSILFSSKINDSKPLLPQIDKMVIQENILYISLQINANTHKDTGFPSF